MAGSPQQHTGMPNTFGLYCLTPPVGRTGVSGEHPQLLADHRLFSCRDLVDSSNPIIDKIPLRIQRMTYFNHFATETPYYIPFTKIIV